MTDVAAGWHSVVENSKKVETFGIEGNTRLGQCSEFRTSYDSESKNEQFTRGFGVPMIPKVRMRNRNHRAREFMYTNAAWEQYTKNA